MDQLVFPLNITIVQGIDYQFVTTWYLEDGVTPRDMTGALITLTVKPVIDDDDTDSAAYIALNTVDFTFDEDPDGPMTGELNRISAVIPRGLTAPIPVGTFPMDMDILQSGFLNTYGSGQFVVGRQVGRRLPS